MKVLNVLHHVFAIAAVVFSALLWWPLSIAFALLYVFEFVFLRPRTRTEATAREQSHFYAPTRAETPPGFFSEDSSSSPPQLDDTFDDSFESIPLHDVEVLQAAFEHLPDDAVITVDNSSANPWQDALEHVREMRSDTPRTNEPTPRADSMQTVADDSSDQWARALAHIRAGDTGDETPVTPVTGVPHHLREATKEEDE